MPEVGNAVGIVLNDLVDSDRPFLQINVVPGKRGQLTPAQAGEHHNDRHRLRTVGRVPYPLLFLVGQSAALLLLAAHGCKLYLFFRVCGNDPANGPLHDLADRGAVQAYRAL